MKRLIFRLLATGCAVGLLSPACSSDSKPSTQSDDQAQSSVNDKNAEPNKSRPEGRLPDELTEITGGSGKAFLGQSLQLDLTKHGYVETEYRVAGQATSYEGDTSANPDGVVDAKRLDDPVAYATRIVVRRPKTAADANGTVLVEWLNVSGGVDANPDFMYAADEIIRRGYTWVGVSAQTIGVEGGPTVVGLPGIAGSIAGKGIKALDPARYSTLSHPGDTYSYNMYTQVARALRDPELGTRLLGDIALKQMLAIGESQSAFALTTYYDAVQPIEGQFDGFLIHSRGGGPLPLRSEQKALDIVAAIQLPPLKIRTDREEPVMMLLSESDVTSSVLGYYKARQPDTDTIRVWEVAGIAHADAFILGPLADQAGCGGQINTGPHQFAVRAALRALDQWVATGEAPPHGTPLELADGPSGATQVRDELGFAKGGIRLPQVAVPAKLLSGAPVGDASIICLLLGSTKDLAPEQIRGLYSSVDDYNSAYEKATDESIKAGFLLAEDKQAVLAQRQPELIAAALTP